MPSLRTLSQIANRLNALAPSIPFTLCMQFVAWRYRQILDYNGGMWSFQLLKSTFQVQPSIAGECSVTPGGTAVSNVTGTVLPTTNGGVAGMQCYFANFGSAHDITSNTSNSFTITPPFGWYATGQQTMGFNLTQSYFTPSDSSFERLISFVDAIYARQLPIRPRIEELNNKDPMRTSIGVPFELYGMAANAAYLSQLPNGVTDIYGQTNASTPVPRYELWPRPIQPYTYSYFYKTHLADLDASNPGATVAPFIPETLLIEGALADVSMYPGTPELRNPHYNPINSQKHEAKFTSMLTDEMLLDRSVAQGNLKSLEAQAHQLGAPLGSTMWDYSHVFGMED